MGKFGILVNDAASGESYRVPFYPWILRREGQLVTYVRKCLNGKYYWCLVSLNYTGDEPTDQFHGLVYQQLIYGGTSLMLIMPKTDSKGRLLYVLDEDQRDDQERMKDIIFPHLRGL